MTNERVLLVEARMPCRFVNLRKLWSRVRWGRLTFSSA